MLTSATVVKTNVYVKNSCDNLIKFFMIHKMYGHLRIIQKEINAVFVSVIICSVAANLTTHPPEGKETSITVY